MFSLVLKKKLLVISQQQGVNSPPSLSRALFGRGVSRHKDETGWLIPLLRRGARRVGWLIPLHWGACPVFNWRCPKGGVANSPPLGCLSRF